MSNPTPTDPDVPDRPRTVTQELRAESAQLRELQRKKQVLAALVVHDLRNPVAALLGNLEMLREELGAQASVSAIEMVSDCTELTHKVLSLVNGILDVEELEEGLLHAQPTRVAMADLMRRIAKSNLVPMRMREIRFEVQIAEDLEADVDAELFHRLIENLLDNAVRHATRRGKVMIDAELRDGELRFRVGNDGPPPPIEERVRLFDRYYRIAERRAAARSNRGLGLHFCRLAAEAHRGSVSVEDADPGTWFVVTIPQPGPQPGPQSSRAPQSG